MAESPTGMPHSEKSEATTLGAIFVRPACFLDVVGCVSAEDFYAPAHRAIFAAMAELDGKQLPIDMLTVWETMQRSGSSDRLNAVGGEKYFEELLTRVVTVENVRYHARRVRKKAERRRWVAIAREIAVAGIANELDDDEYFAEAEARILELTSRRRTVTGPEHIAPTLHSVSRAVDARYENRGRVTGVSSGFPSLDAITSGFQAGDLIILAGRPSMGKSACMSNIATRAAAMGSPQLIFSLEMSSLSLAERMIADEGNVSAFRIRSGQMDGQFTKFTNATITLSSQPIWIDPTGGLTIAEIRSRSRRWRMQLKEPKNTPMVLVDYIQLVAGSGKKNSNREQEISEVSRNLKALAKELECPVIALSQLNRALESRTDKRPMMSDLRESGAIEQDADVIAFLYRDEVYHPQTQDKGIAELIVSKHRNGPPGTVRLRWESVYTRFESLQA